MCIYLSLQAVRGNVSKQLSVCICRLFIGLPIEVRAVLQLASHVTIYHAYSEYVTIVAVT